MKKRTTLTAVSLLFFFAAALSVQAQIKLGDNPREIHPQALLELESTSQGLLIPRMTTAQRDAAFGNNVPDGMVIYNTSEKTLQYGSDNEWKTSQGSGALTGNGAPTSLEGIDPGTLYIDTASGALYIATDSNRWETVGEQDGQTLNISGNTLTISEGNTVVLPTTVNTDEQTLTYSGTTLSIAGGNSVELDLANAGTDSQSLDLVGDDLSIEGGNTVDLSTITPNLLSDDDGDSYVHIDNNVINITADGNLGLQVTSGGVTTGGRFATLQPLRIQDTLEDGTNSAGTTGQILSSTGDGVLWIDPTTNTDSQTIAAGLNGNILELLPENTTISTTVDLSKINTISSADNQARVVAQSNGTLVLYGQNIPALQIVGGGAGGTIRSGTTLSVDSSIHINSRLLDTDLNAGTSGQILSSTGTGVDWIDPTTNTDSQTIAAGLNGNILELLPENTQTSVTVDLSALTVTPTSIENGGSSIDIAADGHVTFATANGTTAEIFATNGNMVVSQPFYVTDVLGDADADVGTAGQILSATGTGTDWIDPPSGSETPTTVADADGDTTVTVESATDEDIIRFRTGATQANTRLLIESNPGSNFTAVLGNQPDSRGEFQSRFRVTAGDNDTSNDTQGASIDLHGNNHWQTPGRLDLVAGSAATVTNPNALFGDQAITFWTNDGTTQGQRMTITGAGNVGIGTTAPTYDLSVDGDAQVTGILYDSSDDAGTNGQILSTTSTGTDWIDPPSGSETPTTLADADGDTRIQVEETSNDDTIRFDIAGNERMTLDTNGRLVVNGVTPQDVPTGSSQLVVGTSGFEAYEAGGFTVYNATMRWGAGADLFNGELVTGETGTDAFGIERDTNGQDWGIGYSLGTAYQISSIRLGQRTDCCPTRSFGGVFRLYNGGQLVATSATITTASASYTTAYTPNVVADEIRYIFPNGADSGFGDGLANMVEFEIIGRQLQSVIPNVVIADGNVGIGDDTPTEARLVVNGDISASGAINANATLTPDYVFQHYYTGSSALNPSYSLPSLESVAAFTKKHHHLPGVTSAKVREEKGLNLGRATEVNLEKIEELYLHTIEQEAKLKKQQVELQQQAKEIEALKNLVNQLLSEKQNP